MVNMIKIAEYRKVAEVIDVIHPYVKRGVSDDELFGLLYPVVVKHRASKDKSQANNSTVHVEDNTEVSSTNVTDASFKIDFNEGQGA